MRAWGINTMQDLSTPMQNGLQPKEMGSFSQVHRFLVPYTWLPALQDGKGEQDLKPNSTWPWPIRRVHDSYM